MKQLSDHVFMSEDEEIACLRDVDNNYVLVSRTDVFYEAVYDTLEEVKKFIKHYDELSEEDKQTALENARTWFNTIRSISFGEEKAKNIKKDEKIDAARKTVDWWRNC